MGVSVVPVYLKRVIGCLVIEKYRSRVRDSHCDRARYFFSSVCVGAEIYYSLFFL